MTCYIAFSMVNKIYDQILHTWYVVSGAKGEYFDQLGQNLHAETRTNATRPSAGATPTSADVTASEGRSRVTGSPELIARDLPKAASLRAAVIWVLITSSVVLAVIAFVVSWVIFRRRPAR